MNFLCTQALRFSPVLQRQSKKRNLQTKTKNLNSSKGKVHLCASVTQPHRSRYKKKYRLSKTRQSAASAAACTGAASSFPPVPLSNLMSDKPGRSFRDHGICSTHRLAYDTSISASKSDFIGSEQLGLSQHSQHRWHHQTHQHSHS